MAKYSDAGYSAASALGGTEYWACVQGGATRIVSANQVKTLVLAGFSANGLSLGAAADYAAMRTLLSLGSAAQIDIDTDGTLAANSDAKIATQKAVRTYVAAAVTGLLDFKGSTDCSADPNYPAASKGDAYVVSVAGKIGGGSGASVDVGDVFVASADNAGGTQASVGSSWFILEHNLTGAALSGAITTSGLTMATGTILGRTTASTGAIEEIAIGSGLSLAAGVLSATGFAGSGAITGSGLTMATARLLGRTTASTGAVEEITVGAGLSLAAGSLTADSTAIKPTECLIIACGDETTPITTGTAKVTFRMPYAFTATEVRGSVTTAPTGSTIIIDINEGGASILSTKLSIDASEKTSTTAASAAVISDSSLADDAEMTIDFDQVGSTVAGAGVKVTLIGHRA